MIAVMREPRRARSLRLIGVVMDQRGAAAAPGRVAGREHRDDVVELLAREIAIRIGAAQEVEERVLVPFLGGRFGDDLLREHVERLLRDADAVELAVPHGAHHRRAFDRDRRA